MFKFNFVRSILLPAIICLLVIFSASGQGFYSPQTFSTPYGNVTTYQYHHLPNTYYRGNNGPVSGKTHYRIVFKNDSILNVYGKINIKDSVQSITYKLNKQKYKVKPSETKELVFKSYMDEVERSGIPTDSCWLFRSASGKINSYSYLPYEGTMFIIAIQKGTSGPIVNLSKETLLEMIADNPKAIKKAENDNFYDAIRVYNK